MTTNSFVPFNQTDDLYDLPDDNDPNTWAKSFCRADGIKYGIAAKMANAPFLDYNPRGNEVAYLMIIFTNTSQMFVGVRQIVLFGEYLFAIDMKPDMFLNSLSDYQNAVVVVQNQTPNVEKLSMPVHATFGANFIPNTIFNISEIETLLGTTSLATTYTVRSGVNAFGKFPVPNGFQMFPHWLMHCDVKKLSDLAGKITYVSKYYLPSDVPLDATNNGVLQWINSLPSFTSEPFPEYDVELIPFIHHEFPSWGFDCVPQYVNWLTNDYVDMPVSAIECDQGTVNYVSCSTELRTFKWPFDVGDPPPHSNKNGPFDPVTFNSQIAQIDAQSKVTCADTLTWVDHATPSDVALYFWSKPEPFVVEGTTYDLQEPIKWNVRLVKPAKDKRVDTFGISFRGDRMVDITVPEKVAHRIVLKHSLPYEPVYPESESVGVSNTAYGHLGLTPIQVWAINPETHTPYKAPSAPTLIYTCVAAISHETQMVLLVSLGEVVAIIATPHANLAPNVTNVDVNGVKQLTISNWPMHSNHFDYLQSQLVKSTSKKYFYTAYAIMNAAGKQHFPGTDWPEWTRFLKNPSNVRWVDSVPWSVENFGLAFYESIKSKLPTLLAQTPATSQQLAQLLATSVETIHEPFLACTVTHSYYPLKKSFKWLDDTAVIPTGLVSCDPTQKFDRNNRVTTLCNTTDALVTIPLLTNDSIYPSPKSNLVPDTLHVPAEFPSLVTYKCEPTKTKLAEYIGTFNLEPHVNGQYATFLPNFEIDAQTIKFNDQNAYPNEVTFEPTAKQVYFNSRSEMHHSI